MKENITRRVVKHWN